MSVPFSSLHLSAAQNGIATADVASGGKSVVAQAAASAVAGAVHAFENVPPSPRLPRAATSPATAPDAISNAPLKGRDPLYRRQWHLKNRGQYAFARDRPTPGVDLNIGNLHRSGITGKGVVVGVRDAWWSFIDAGHEDLAPNMVLPPRKTWDKALYQKSEHATGTAGIIAAVGGNGKGGRGVAPEASILDLRRIEDRRLPRPLLVNESLGSNRTAFPAYLKHKVFEDGRRNAQLIVKAAGNEFMGNARRQFARRGNYPHITEGADVGWISANIDVKGSRWNVMNVGAVNAEGRKASYSRVGSSLWVSGLGGESGLEEGGHIAWGGHDTPDKAFYGPALIAPDVTDCGAGWDYSDNPGSDKFFNALDAGRPSELDPNCRYTARFNGTSAAAPTVTGVAALMLQVNPALTWRDIKYLLAVTARKVDADRQPIKWKGMTVDDGWVINAAGRSFSNWYGFGLVNAKRAVDAARNFRGLAPAIDSGWRRSTGEPVPIPYRDEAGGYSAIRFSGNLRVEAVQLRLRTTHSEPHNLRIALISPSGTRSIILPPLTNVELWKNKKTFSIDRVASNAFLDENAKGVWKLQVIDVLNPDSDSSKLVSWELRVLGH